MDDNKSSQPNNSPWLRVNSAPAEAVKAVLDQGTIGYLASARAATQGEPKTGQNVIIHDGKLQPNGSTQQLGVAQPQRRHDAAQATPSAPQTGKKGLTESELEALKYAQSWQQPTQPTQPTQPRTSAHPGGVADAANTTNAANTTSSAGAASAANAADANAGSASEKPQLSDDEIIANVYRSFEDWGQQRDNVKRDTPKRDTVTRHAASRKKDKADRDDKKPAAASPQTNSTVPGAPKLVVPPVSPPPESTGSPKPAVVDDKADTPTLSLIHI